MTRDVDYVLPILTGRGQNNREHHMVRHKRVKAEREAAFYATPAHLLPCVVTLTRHSPGTLDDDNLSGSMKAIRDGVADRLGVDDRDPRVSWRYAQHRTKIYGVRIQITSTETHHDH